MALRANIEDRGGTIEIVKPVWICGKCGAKGPAGQISQTSSGGLLVEFPPPDGWIALAVPAPAGMEPREEPLISCPACWPGVYRKLTVAFSPLITLAPKARLPEHGN